MSNPTQNSYSKVIFRNFDDKKAQKMVNSYRFKSSSPNRYRVWSPQISKEERFKRKRIREEEYIQDFHREDRPILLIQKKHQYPKVKQQNLFNAPEENYYKVSENTNVIEDVGEEIHTKSAFTQRQTFHHGKPNKTEEESFFKVEGLEFLPEGFLELDPLLYHDEYEFENQVHKQFFDKEQRKVKALRRKQYKQKNHQKMREVTIFLVDERRDKIVDYLEKWYFKNKRRMTKEELQYIAQLLQSDEATLKSLQNMFLEKKKHLNRQSLRTYLTQHGKIKDGKFIIPPSLQNYFKKKTDPYGHVKSRLFGYKKDHANIKQQQEKLKLQKANKNRFTRRFRGSKSLSHIKGGRNRFSQSNNQNQRSEYKNKTLSHTNPYTQGQDFRQLKNSFSNNLSQMNNQKKQAQSGMRINDRANGQRNSSNRGEEYKKGYQDISGQDFAQQNRYEDDTSRYQNPSDNLAKYFDSEVNRILDKIQGTSKFDQKLCEMQIPNEKKIMNCNLILNKNTQSNKYIQSFKKKIIPQAKKSYRKEIELLINNKRPSKHLKVSNGEKIRNRNVTRFQEKKESIAIEDIKVPSEHFSVPQEEVDNNKAKTSDSNLVLSQKKILNQGEATIKNYIRSTIIQKNDNDQSTIILQKLQPQLVANEYYYQLIEDVVDQFGQRTVSVITKSERGQIISKKYIPENLFTDNYKNKVIRQVSEIDGGFDKLLVVLNDKEQAVSVSPMRYNPKSLFGRQEIQKRMNCANHRNSVVIEMDTDSGVKRVHSLPPIMLFGTKFQYKIIEVEEEDTKNLNIITLDNKGKVIQEELIQEKGEENKSQQFYTEVQDDYIDDNGVRNITLNTINEKGQILTSHNFKKSVNFIEGMTKVRAKTIISPFQKRNNQKSRCHTINPIVMGKDFIYQNIKETVDVNGNKSFSLITKNQNGKKISICPIENNLIGENYHSEIIEENTLKDGKKLFTIQTKNNRGQTVGVNRIKPSFNSVLGESILIEYNKKSQNKASFLQKTFYKGVTKVKHIIRPVIVGNIYFQQVIEQSNEQDFILSTFNQTGKLVSQMDLDPIFIQGEFFMTEVVTNIPFQSSENAVLLRTLNENALVIAEQTIIPENIKIIDQNSNREFDQEENSIKEEEYEVGSVKIRKKSFRPTFIEGEQYQQVLQEMISQNGQKEVCMITKNSIGELIEVQRVDPNIQLKNLTQQQRKSSRGVSIIISNSDGVKIQEQIVDNSNFKCLKHFNNSNICVKKTEIDINGNSVIYYFLKPTCVGEIYYQQTIKQYIDENNKNVQEVITKNQNGGDVDIKFLEKVIIGQNFKTLQSNINLNEKGLRNVTLETVNEKDQVLCKLLISQNESNEEEIFFDNKNINKLNENKILEEVDGKTLKRTYILRPTVVGVDYYQHMIEEIFDENNRIKRTLKVYDENKSLITEQSLNKNLSNENYEVLVTEEVVNENGQRMATISLLNDKGEILNQLNQETDLATNINEYNYTEFQDTYDDENKRQNVISIKKQEDSEFRTHSLRPTLIGGMYYQQVVNEILNKEDNSKNFGTIVTCNENGKIVSVENIGKEQLGEHYYNVLQTRIDQNKQRTLSLKLFNNSGEIISEQSIKPRIFSLSQKSYDHNMVELIDEDGQQEILVISQDFENREKVQTYISQNLGSLQLSVIKEETEEIDQEMLKMRNRYFDHLIEQFKIERREDRYTQLKKKPFKVKDRAHTFNAKDIQRKKKSAKPKNISRRNFKSKTIQKSTKIQEKRKNQTVADKNKSYTEGSLLEKLYGDQKKISSAYRDKFEKQMKETDSNNLEMGVILRKQTQILDELERIDSNSARVQEIIEIAEQAIQNQKKVYLNTPENIERVRQATVLLQMLKNSAQNTPERIERIKRVTVSLLSLKKIKQNDFEIVSQIRQKTVFLQKLKKHNMNHPENMDIIKRSTIQLQQLKQQALNQEPELISSKKKETMSLLTKKRVFQNQQVEQHERIKKNTINLLQFKEQEQNKFEIHDRIRQKTITLQRLVNQGLNSVEHFEQIRKITQQLQSLKEQEMDIDNKDMILSENNQNSFSSFRNEDNRMAKTEINMNAQTQDFSENIRTKALSEYDNRNSDPKDFLIQKSQKLKGYLDDYIDILQAEKVREKEHKIQKQQEDFMRQTIEEVFNKEKEKLSDDIVAKINRKLSQPNGPNNAQDSDLLDEFYEFCQETLPEDSNYKESIMFVSLFYYFMEKKKLLK